MNLTTIINTKKCAILEQQTIGSRQAAGLMVHVRLEPTDRASSNENIILTNIYIRPRATYAELSKLFNDIVRGSGGEMSRILIAGDLNASAPG